MRFYEAVGSIQQTSEVDTTSVQNQLDELSGRVGAALKEVVDNWPATAEGVGGGTFQHPQLVQGMAAAAGPGMVPPLAAASDGGLPGGTNLGHGVARGSIGGPSDRQQASSSPGTLVGWGEGLPAQGAFGQLAGGSQAASCPAPVPDATGAAVCTSVTATALCTQSGLGAGLPVQASMALGANCEMAGDRAAAAASARAAMELALGVRKVEQQLGSLGISPDARVAGTGALPGVGLGGQLHGVLQQAGLQEGTNQGDIQERLGGNRLPRDDGMDIDMGLEGEVGQRLDVATSVEDAQLGEGHIVCKVEDAYAGSAHGNNAAVASSGRNRQTSRHPSQRHVLDTKEQSEGRHRHSGRSSRYSLDAAAHSADDIYVEHRSSRRDDDEEWDMQMENVKDKQLRGSGGGYRSSSGREDDKGTGARRERWDGVGRGQSSSHREDVGGTGGIKELWYSDGERHSRGSGRSRSSNGRDHDGEYARHSSRRASYRSRRGSGDVDEYDEQTDDWGGQRRYRSNDGGDRYRSSSWGNQEMGNLDMGLFGPGSLGAADEEVCCEGSYGRRKRSSSHSSRSSRGEDDDHLFEDQGQHEGSLSGDQQVLKPSSSSNPSSYYNSREPGAAAASTTGLVVLEEPGTKKPRLASVVVVGDPRRSKDGDAAGEMQRVSPWMFLSTASLLCVQQHAWMIFLPHLYGLLVLCV